MVKLSHNITKSSVPHNVIKKDPKLPDYLLNSNKLKYFHQGIQWITHNKAGPIAGNNLSLHLTQPWEKLFVYIGTKCNNVK